MQRWKSSSAVVGVLVFIAGAVGCSDDETVAGVAPAPAVNQVDVAPGVVSGFDAKLSQMTGQDLPGFGGVFFDDEGNLTVFMKNPAAADAASIRSELVRMLPDVDGLDAPIRIVRADYEFSELEGWRQKARSEVLGSPGVLSLDVDEVRNRVTVGIEAGTPPDAIRNLLRAADIPAAAVIIQVEEPVHFSIGARPAPSTLVETLSSEIRPVVAGTRIRHEIDGGCTAGPTALWGASRAVLINSHCSGGQGGVITGAQTVGQPSFEDDGGPAFALGGPTPGSGPTPNAPTDPTNANIGDEWSDPFWLTTLPGCPSGKVCRKSDAAIVAMFGNVESDLGKIAKTTGIGSTTIDASSPRWTVIGENVPLVNQTVHRVGITSGYRNGPVTNTCKDTTIGGFTVLCSWWFSTFSGGGDSGAPVFRVISATTAKIVGINFGSNMSNTKAMFSPLAGIREELETPQQPLVFF